MSIRDEIRKHLASQRLFAVEPALLSDPVERTLFVSPEINSLLMGPWTNEAMERRCGRLRADLEHFVTGGLIRMCLVPHQHRAAFMGRLDKPTDEVWDIRSRDPDPGLRVFGRFAETNVFVALNLAPRSVRVPWLPNRPLGSPRTSYEWDLAILECQDRWSKLFPEHQPVHGENCCDYVSVKSFPV
jgi:hypothetical protein